MTATLNGRCAWRGFRDSNGHRTWELSSKVITSTKSDGPQTVMACAGLPSIGITYGELATVDSRYWGNDVDDWAFCYPDMQVDMISSNDDNTLSWLVRQKFSTLPLIRCMTNQVGDPLQEPDRIGGSFVRFLKAAIRDRFGLAIMSSSWELFRGRDVEFDSSYPTVYIEQNVADLALDTFSQYIDCVNDSILWGMNPRCVKLSNAPWQRHQQGTCSFYYTRRFEFDVNFNTFDRYIQDEGTKVLNGHHRGPNDTTGGAGCTINVTTVSDFSGNAITAYTITNGGTDYPASQTFPLAVYGSVDGNGATIIVTTNGSGVVTTAGVVSNGGQDYIADDDCTTLMTGWVLDNINGQAPDYRNPQHFIRYKDRNGECARVILDGRGQPAINKYPGQSLVEKYPERNLLDLGIPTTL